MNRRVDFDSIDSYHRTYGLTTLHPLVSVVDLKEATKELNHVRIHYGMYAIFLKNGINCRLHYGRNSYDYQQGTVLCFAPGQVVEYDMENVDPAPDVVGILFHPDILYGTPLADKIGSFGFFNYSEREALHLSQDEREKFLFCLELIKKELSHPVDHHSASVICANIQLLLEYLDRYYDRQFITRHKINSEVVDRFQQDLKEYYASGAGKTGTPNVAYFAQRVNLTPGYFGDLIRKETGNTPKDIITLHVVNEAKRLLSTTRQDISEIAYSLGFEYPAHFTRMFKRITGQNPTQYRASRSIC